MQFDRFRLIFSLILLLCFVTTVFLVLFFTFGYRFNFDRGIFIYTGSVTLKSNPRSISVFLDGKAIDTGVFNAINQSYHIAGIQPGEHFLRVESDGFRPWEKKVTVQSGISTEFWNVLLPRNEYPATMESEGWYQRFFPSPGNDLLAAVGDHDGETTVVVIDRASGTESQVFSTRKYRFDYDDEENIEWSEDKKNILIPVRTDDGKPELFLVGRETKQATLLSDISDIQQPLNARWHPDNDGSVFILSGSSLFLVRPNTTDANRRSLLIAENISAFDLSNSALYFLDKKDGIIRRSSLGNEERMNPTPVTDPILQASEMKSPLLTVYDEKRIALLDPGRAGVLWNDDGDIRPAVVSLGEGIRSIQFSDDGKKLLFCTENEIAVIFTRDWDVQPARKSGEIVQIARFSSTLTSPQWAKDYQHILFSSGSDVVIAELDHRDRRQLETLTEFPERKLRQILSLPGENKLLFLTEGASEKTASILSVDFPENEGLFGN